MTAHSIAALTHDIPTVDELWNSTPLLEKNAPNAERWRRRQILSHNPQVSFSYIVKSFEE